MLYDKAGLPSGLKTCCLGSSLWGYDGTAELLNLVDATDAACLSSLCRVSIS